MRAQAAQFKVGDKARTLYWTPGAGASGIPAESLVIVLDVAARSRGEMPRYAIGRTADSPRLWVYQDVLEAVAR